MSQHSTTTTTTYDLLKYSKSYDNSEKPGSEWQHFVNPVIKLLLDVKKSPKGELTSVRLRIIWIMSNGNDSMDVDNREVVFEDIDLLAFSLMLSSHVQPSRGAQGLPLKAVHRDTTVGIRYLHPIAVQANSTPSYRRFQMTFESSNAASQFVDVIRNVCPCKPHEPPRNNTTKPPSARTQTHAAPRHILPATHSLMTPAPARNPLSTISPAVPASAMPSSPFEASSSGFNVLSFQTPALSTPLNLSSSPTLSTSKSQKLPAHHSTAKVASLRQDSSLPDSSQPSDNSDSSSMLPPPVPSRNLSTTTPNNVSGGILESLQETSMLHNLSNPDLEKLVSQVVREEGFLELLEKLDTMWRVKGYLERRA